MAEQKNTATTPVRDDVALRDEVMRRAIQGISSKDLMSFTSEQIEAIYARAYNLYQTGQYKEAAQLFRLLIILDANSEKFTLGLAACYHMMKEYRNAIQMYMRCTIFNLQSPIPCLHASDCFIQMRDRVAALIALDMAVNRSGNKPEYQVLKERALLSMASLKKELAATQNVQQIKK